MSNNIPHIHFFFFIIKMESRKMSTKKRIKKIVIFKSNNYNFWEKNQIKCISS